MRHSLLAIAVSTWLLGISAQAFEIAVRGKAKAVIVQQPGASPAEQTAARELANYLQQITGTTFQIKYATSTNLPSRAIIVGPGEAAAKVFPEIDFTKLGPEEIVMRTKGDNLLLAGGRPRGTLYAVETFLQEQCGVRWWTPWATNVPHHATLRIGGVRPSPGAATSRDQESPESFGKSTPLRPGRAPSGPIELDVHEKPVFEYREPFWSAGFDPLWKARNGANGEHSPIPAELGGCIKYKGFAHTFYALVPPEKHFAAHPEWFSQINGKRTADRAQLCLSNPELRDFVVSRVKAWLRESPDCEIVSLTQNDWHGACQCPNCKAIEDAEDGPSGSMIAFVNFVAEKIEPEFPNVAVDTFAYQYTRHPPKTLHPRPNVIVRLCSIECNFRAPLDDPSNAAFLADLQGWSKLCRRLYVWDYVTDFANYVLPHPNWFVLGPNLRLFEKYNVKGVFEEGAYAGAGAEMAELRAWVLAQLLWNPQQDDRALIQEFLDGYYGKAAAKPIRRYLDLMQESSKGFYLACYTRPNAPFRSFKVLAEAETLWQQAERASTRDPEKLQRVRIAHLPVRLAFLRDWTNLREECRKRKAKWPLPELRKVVADQFGEVCHGIPGQDWTHVRVLNEPGLTVEKFLQQFAQDPPASAASVPAH